MRLCLNMIVRNEADKIIRCLSSIAPHIQCAAILDTGSTDGTVAKIARFFGEKGIPAFITHGKFHNFSQARNLALDHVRKLRSRYDYILLADADMELSAETKFPDTLTGECYEISQRSGSLVYNNARLLRQDSNAKYVGSTHEYLDVASSGVIDTALFIDHADGTNRKDKYARDIMLLKQDAMADPKNPRPWFYLGQSFRDAGRPKEAAAAYKKRVDMGGWDEEVWNAQLNYAYCLRAMDDEAGFIRNMLIAYNMRPTRMETLYDIAKYYREKGMNGVGLMFAEAGINRSIPNDKLFVNEFPYITGLPEEFSIMAYYTPEKRKLGAMVCDQLSLGLQHPEANRWTARNNMFFYLEPLSKILPSFRCHKLDNYPVSEGFIGMNPSVTRYNSQIMCNIRTVNYKIDKQGRYEILGKDGTYCDTHPIVTKNVLATLDYDLNVEHAVEICPSVGEPAPKWDKVIGHEDIRLFAVDGGLSTLACRRDQNEGGVCEQVLSNIVFLPSGTYINTGHRIIHKEGSYEKNWMPARNGHHFIYRLGTVVDTTGKIVKKFDTKVDTSTISGGSQLVTFRDGYIALVHEARINPSTNLRYYIHRFVYFTNELAPVCLSMPFYFLDKQIEFAAGLAWHPDNKRLILSFGARDSEAWIGTVDATEVAQALIK